MNILERVSQLWCLPQHEKKVMDPDMANSMRALGEEIYVCAFEKGREIEAGRKDLKSAVETLARALREDPAFYYAYQSNIAVQVQDEFKAVVNIHEVSNNAARKFLDLFIGETTKATPQV